MSLRPDHKATSYRGTGRMPPERLIVSAHQVGYFPWLGLLHKVACSDVFISLDCVQFNRRAYQHRTYVRAPEGLRYLSVPVHSKGHQSHALSLQDVTIDSTQGFQPTHYETLRHLYAATPGWDDHEPYFHELLLERDWSLLSPLNHDTFAYTCESFGVETAVLHASELQPEGRKSELILDLCLKVGADIYLSGIGAREYMKEKDFRERGIEVRYQDFCHPTYPQRYESFQEGCFSLDLLLNTPDEGREIFWSSVPPRSALAER